MNEISILLGAEIEFQQAYAWLAQSDLRLAERFDLAVSEALRQLAAMPRSAPLHAGKYRRLLMRPYPYALFYTIEGERIFVQALLDVRQDPEVIRRRLGT